MRSRRNQRIQAKLREVCKHRRKRELREISESIDYLKQHFRIDFWVRKFGIIGGEEKKMLCASSRSNIPSQRILVSFSFVCESDYCSFSLSLRFQLHFKVIVDSSPAAEIETQQRMACAVGSILALTFLQGDRKLTYFSKWAFQRWSAGLVNQAPLDW